MERGIVSEIRKKQPYYFLILPAIIIYSLFTLYPLIQTFVYSLYYHPFFPEQRFIGLQNYITIFTKDPRFLRAFKNSLTVVALTIVGQAGLGLLLAVAISDVASRRLRTIYTMVLFWPQMMSWVAVGQLFSRIFDPFYGLLNMILTDIGLESLTQPWLAQPSTAIFCAILMCIWRSTSFSMLIFYAGLQGIDPSLYEAAWIDGAGRISTFLYVTIPCLKPLILVVVSLITMGSFQVFDIMFVVGGGSPLLPYLDVMATTIYDRAFFFNQFGWASALAFVLIFVILIASIAYIKQIER